MAIAPTEEPPPRLGTHDHRADRAAAAGGVEAERGHGMMTRRRADWRSTTMPGGRDGERTKCERAPRLRRPRWVPAWTAVVLRGSETT
ncbi:MAG TPA: hypothetical protein VEK07_14890 [Polyangiaceae bacterium]|nr:hypothetical protein [Polyangiaceae bacterium]